MAAHTQLWTTGPSDVAIGINSVYSYLGFSENGFQVRIGRHFRPIHIDPAGPEMPADMMTAGRSIVVAGQLTKFDWAVYKNLEKGFIFGSGLSGTIEANENGSLLVTEGMTYVVLLRYLYSTKTAYSGLDAGIRILNAYSQGDTAYQTGATNNIKPSIAFAGIVNFNTGTNVGTIWDGNISAFPAAT